MGYAQGPRQRAETTVLVSTQSILESCSTCVMPPHYDGWMTWSPSLFLSVLTGFERFFSLIWCTLQVGATIHTPRAVNTPGHRHANKAKDTRESEEWPHVHLATLFLSGQMLSCKEAKVLLSSGCRTPPGVFLSNQPTRSPWCWDKWLVRCAWLLSEHFLTLS
uniref:Uncharacterized protein n=1 Tax=Eutreptiella gymnastica TaxID=73025 RepID=A0A7S1I011_9EUGL|mmetsp:Transcript_117703/g.204939  ORF Transcript_117703/g.204939 Transcript_117703/m.204939 type:complete len:163 (+) Transcript_117703:399-887(+)